MRTWMALILTVAACSVPDKQPLASDGGVDSPGNTGPLETTITQAPPDFSSSAVAVFEFTSNLPTAKFECSIDRAPAAPCTSPYTQTLGDGAHAFSVRATDGSGHSDESPAEHLWSIDTVAPETTLTEAPAVADNSTMVTFRFTSNEMFVTFECSLDEAAYTMCRSGDVFGPISDGTHSFAVRAKDRAGNADASPAIHAWTVDTSTPDTTLLSGPVGAVNSRDASFAFVSPDAGSGATYQCQLDGSAWVACTSPQNYSNLAMGQHTFAVRVRDGVGNVDPSPATRTWTIDADPPETTITSAPSGTISMASASITFTADENEVTYECSLDGSAYAACTSPYNAVMLGQGAHTFSVRATDIAGNTDPTPATASWTVDTIAPGLTITGGPDDNGTTGPRVVFSFAATEGTVECSIDGGAFAACTSAFGFNAAAGSHTFTVRSTDAAGNSTSATRTWTVACAAPDPTGALGVLHLDDTGQVLANATGGAPATLGTTDQPETVDPALTTGRFNGGLAFTASEGDVVAWPLAAGTTGTLSIELWAAPSALAGTRDIFVSGDNRVAIRVTTSGANVVFSATVVESGGTAHTVTSAPVAASAWHHVLVALSEPSLILWVDGARTEVGSVTVGTPPSLDSIRLGGSYGGDLDEVWLSATPITDNETARGRFCPTSGVVL